MEREEQSMGSIQEEEEEEEGEVEENEEETSFPGFRICPTDEELFVYYLMPKVLNLQVPNGTIQDVDFYSFHPWDLHRQFRMNMVKESYTFTRTVAVNRALCAGFWNLVGIEYIRNIDWEVIGVRKTMVFRKGNLSKWEETDWFVYEYHINQDPNSNLEINQAANSNLKPAWDDWVLCKLFHTYSEVDEEERRQALINYDSNVSRSSSHQGKPKFHVSTKQYEHSNVSRSCRWCY